MSNPYAMMKPAPSGIPPPLSGQQSLPQSIEPQDLPQLTTKDKKKLGRSMKRRMSVSHPIDLKHVLHKQLVPSLPQGIINQYATQDTQQHHYAGLPQNSLEKGLERQRSQRSLSRRPSISSLKSARQNTKIDVTTAPPVPKVINSVKGIDLTDQNVLRILNDPQFDANAFITSRLGDSTASEIDRFSSNLATLKKKVDGDIKADALKTYDRLLNTTTQLQSTESELKVLRSVVMELLEVSNTMRATAELRVRSDLETTSTLTSTRARDRSSVLVLEKLWSTEMQSLFKHVEGASKFISPVPGRHIIAECGRWYELNAATFKTLQPAHIFLLNDLILIATRRRKTAITKPVASDFKSSTAGLVAEQCWPLRDVTLSELGPGQASEGKYGIRITYNSLTYVYQTDRFDHYQSILKGYKKARDDLRDILEAEHLKQKELRDSLNMLSLRDSIQQKRDSHLLLQNVTTRMHGRSRSLDKSSTYRNLKTLDESLDDLENTIFHEKFDEAIEKIDEFETELDIYKAKCGDEELLFYNVISMKLSLKRDEILKKLINILNSNTTSSIAEITPAIRSLSALNQATIAQTLFLNNRSQYLTHLTSQIQETKTVDNIPKVSIFLMENSIVAFQIIRDTITNYRTLFPSGQKQPANLSYIVEWGTGKVKEHLAFVGRKIHGLTLSKNGMESLVMVLHRQGLELKTVGLDVEYLLDDFYGSINS